VARFADAIAVNLDNGAYGVNLDREWTVNGNPHGGYLLAVLARAAVAADSEGEHPHPLSASAVYLSPPTVGPAKVEVEHLRRGRMASQLRARLVQKDKACVEALFTLGRLGGEAGSRWVGEPPVPVAAPEECALSPVEPPGAGVRVEMLDLVEQRLDPASFVGRAAAGERGSGYEGGSGEMRGWLGFADGTPFDPVSLLYAADAFPPATLTLGSVGWVPTLELTVYLRGVPAPGRLRVRQRVRLLEGSMVDQVCDIWDSQGRVVAQASQLALVRMRAQAP
jgi:acyl-CoA thioesterase